MAREPGGLVTHEALRRFTPRELARATVIGVTVTRYLLPGLLRRRDRTAERLAPRVHQAVVALGPPFVKLSQVVASSPGLFPTPISDGLRSLLDEAEPVDWPAIRDTIECELDAKLDQLDGAEATTTEGGWRGGQRGFASVEPEALAAASIAQVHGAVLVDGTRVVIKVRRPGVERQFLTDLRLLRLVARFAQWKWPYARVLNPVAIVDDVVTTLRRELDFRLEADSMERFAANLRSFGSNDRIRVPAVHRELSTRGVLTMERVDGIRVDDLMKLEATGLDLRDLLRAGVRAWIESAVEHGLFHGDVHAGNLMLDNEGRVVFLDFGIVGELDDVTRKLVRRGVTALLHHKDFEAVTDCLVELGAHLGVAGADRQRAAKAIRALAEPLLDKPIAELDYQEIFVSAVRLAAPHNVQLPRSLVLLVKQVIYFERYAKLIAPDWDILADPSLIDFMVEDEV